jgi:hypothetical protein
MMYVLLGYLVSGHALILVSRSDPSLGSITSAVKSDALAGQPADGGVFACSSAS